MWFTSRQHNLNRSHAAELILAPRSPRRRTTFRPQTEALDERCLLSFSSPISTSVFQPDAMVTADINNDGKADLIAITSGSSVVVLLGMGNGHFATPYWVAYSNDIVETLAVADVNGDGKLDVVTGNAIDEQVAAPGPVADVSVLLGDGMGNFTSDQTYWASSVTGPASIAVSDVNGDGRPDIILSGYGSGIDVLMNSGGGVYDAVQSYDTGGSNLFSAHHDRIFPDFPIECS
jgi:hypothetical protein